MNFLIRQLIKVNGINIEIKTGSETIVVKAKWKLKYEAGDELSWQKNKNKILRMKGETYQGQKKNGEGKFHFSECKSARKIGPRCNSTFCIKNSKSRKCPFIKEKDREILFKTFWNDMSWSERRTYVSTLCTIQPNKVNTTGSNDTRRIGTIKYFF